MSTPQIAFLCGSLRAGSINQQLQAALVKRFERAGANCDVIDLGAYDMPLFHGDLDAPATVPALIKRLAASDGVVVISPEYNGSLPPLLKNVIDWTSTLGKAHFEGPYWGIASCTPGPMSGIMCMRQVNYILMRLGAHVSPIQVGCGNAKAAFDADGELIAEPSATLAERLIADMFSRIGKG